MGAKVPREIADRQRLDEDQSVARLLFDDSLPFLPETSSRNAAIAAFAAAAITGAALILSHGRSKGWFNLTHGIAHDTESGAAVMADPIAQSKVVYLDAHRQLQAEQAIPVSTVNFYGTTLKHDARVNFPRLGFYSLPDPVINDTMAQDNLPLSARVAADWTAPAPPDGAALASSRNFPMNLSHEVYVDNTFRMRFQDGSAWTRHTDGTEVTEKRGRVTEITRPDGAGIIDGTLYPGSNRPPFLSEYRKRVQVPELDVDERVVEPWTSKDGAITAFKDGTVLNISAKQESWAILPNGMRLYLSPGKVSFQSIYNERTGQETTYFSNGFKHTVDQDNLSRFEHKFGKTTFDPRSGKSIDNDFGGRTVRWPSGFTMSDYGTGYMSFLDPSGSMLELSPVGLAIKARDDSFRPVHVSSRLNLNPVETLEDGSIKRILSNGAHIVERSDQSLEIVQRSGQIAGTVKADGSLSSEFSYVPDPLAGITPTADGFTVDFGTVSGESGSLSFKSAMRLDPQTQAEIAKASEVRRMSTPSAKIFSFPNQKLVAPTTQRLPDSLDNQLGPVNPVE